MRPIFYSLLLISLPTAAQQKKELSIAFVNAATSLPFAHMEKLFTHIYQPGISVGYGLRLRTKSKHDWVQEFKLGYVYHHYVQHSLSISTAVVYRYKFSPAWNVFASLGAGYMQSIPATAQLHLQANGEYEKHKGWGRMQALATFNTGIAHIFHPASNMPVRIFISSQQLLQFPFIKAYVPLLPYNNLLIGAGIPIHSKK